jgi:maltose alpha-D-glucosyltransferase/alpha-amylase
MQWEPGSTAGFSTGAPGTYCRPLLARSARAGANVREQQRDPGSLLRWIEQVIRTLRECPEVGTGECTVLDLDLPPAMLAHRFDAPEGSILFLHNLAAEPVRVDLGHQTERGEAPFGQGDAGDSSWGRVRSA